jgi:diguanylate cyclase
MMLAELPGRLAPPSGWPAARSGAWVVGPASLLFVGLLAGVLLEPRRARDWRSIPIRAAATLAAACGLLGSEARPRLLEPLAIRACCDSNSLAARLLAVAVASLAAAVLVVTQVAAAYRRRLRERASRSVQELSEVHARLHHVATHDALTGLPNRELLKERLGRALAEAGSGRTVAVAVIDLDRFSVVNHSLGHGVGDRLLEEIARRLESGIPREHTLARIGGDEFAVLINGVAARVEANEITAAVTSAFERPVNIGGEEVRIQPSIGVSVWPDDARRDDDLLAHAEAALQAAKRSASRRVMFFEPGMSDSMQERLALENDLRRALATGEFEVFYHPQLSCRTGRIVGAEALLRWRHPSKGLITPNSFIPLAEQTGLIVPLGAWALREVCRQAREWRVNTGAAPRAAVNMSAAQLRHEDVLQVIRSALGAADLDARALEIELTESTLMTSPEESTAVLERLRAMGVGVAIDDFGTGYSSLSYLRHLPIDKLKIDRSFVRDLPSSRTDEFIVRAVVSLAHSVGLEVVIEGVETAEQLEFIRSLDCDQWQGYYCCEPLPAASFQEMLLEQTVTRTGIIAALTRTSWRPPV